MIPTAHDHRRQSCIVVFHIVFMFVVECCQRAYRLDQLLPYPPPALEKQSNDRIRSCDTSSSAGLWRWRRTRRNGDRRQPHALSSPSKKYIVPSSSATNPFPFLPTSLLTWSPSFIPVVIFVKSSACKSSMKVALSCHDGSR